MRSWGSTEPPIPRPLKKAYRSLAMKYHPDRNPGDNAAAESMKEVNEAYANPQRRQEARPLYDRYGHAGLEGYTQEDIFPGASISPAFSANSGWETCLGSAATPSVASSAAHEDPTPHPQGRRHPLRLGDNPSGLRPKASRRPSPWIEPPRVLAVSDPALRPEARVNARPA